jgi:Domain of unknown function (DUF4372)/Transposase DDE domain
MFEGKYVFAQLVEFLPARIFDKHVKNFQGNKWVKHFSCWNQLLCMMFGQLCNRDSLRDLIIGIDAHPNKHYHLGFGRGVSRSNLANANEKRGYQIFEQFAHDLIAQARASCITDSDFNLPIKGNVYAFDASVIDLCLNVFWWAKFRKNKGALKLHTLYDVKTSIPSFIHITTGSVHDVNGLDVLVYEQDGYYILDRGYVDFKRLYIIHQQKAFFITRAKDNTQLKRIYSSKVDKTTGVLCDQKVKLMGVKTQHHYPEQLRRIKYFDKEQKRTFVFLTNNLSLQATDIAMLYKYRWKVELFFKWIKQHLKIKTFWGTSMNAVKTQVYIAVITYCLIAIIKSKLKVEKSTYEMLQILGISLFDKTQLNQLLSNNINQDVKEQDCNQLKLNLI